MIIFLIFDSGVITGTDWGDTANYQRYHNVLSQNNLNGIHECTMLCEPMLSCC